MIDGKRCTYFETMLLIGGPPWFDGALRLYINDGAHFKSQLHGQTTCVTSDDGAQHAVLKKTLPWPNKLRLQARFGPQNAGVCERLA